jgi:hypothetical protein
MFIGLIHFFITKVTDPTPGPSPTREGREAASSAVLPSLVGEGPGVGSVLLLFMSAFVYSKSLL